MDRSDFRRGDLALAADVFKISQECSVNDATSNHYGKTCIHDNGTTAIMSTFTLNDDTWTFGVGKRGAQSKRGVWSQAVACPYEAM